MTVQDASPNLPAALVGRVIHDVMGPLSGVISGLDLLNDPQARDMHLDALALATASARALHDATAFARILYGAASAPLDAAALESLARGLFADQRPVLHWSMILPAVPAVVGRTLLGLLQVTAEALAAGGEAKAGVASLNGGVILRIDAVGPRLRFSPEALAGLRGLPCAQGLIGKWAPSFYLWTQVQLAGGVIELKTDNARAVLTAQFPP